MTPVTSIVMPVYNAEKYVGDAVQSIINQRGVFNFEVIVVDDGSTDKSVDIVQELGDERFIILRKRTNTGIADSLNIGIKRASAEIITRMDADDIMHPQRLSVQLQFMADNPLIAVTGTYFSYIDEAGNPAGGALQLPVQPDDVVNAFRTICAIGHPTVMFRKSVLMEKTDLYQSKYTPADDLALWLECISKGVLFANFPEVLLNYRIHGNQASAGESGAVQNMNRDQAYRDYGHLIWGDWPKGSAHPPEGTGDQSVASAPN